MSTDGYDPRVTSDERSFRRQFYANVSEVPLEPDDPRYVRLYDEPELVEQDPVVRMQTAIDLSAANSGVHLLSGFRGSGKSTELRRHRHNLREAEYAVLLLDIQDVLDPSWPVDVSDFLLGVAGALGGAAVDAGLVGDAALRDSGWKRFTNFLQSRVEFTEISATVLGVGLQAALHTDPTFRQRLQERSAGHLTALIQEVHAHVRELATLIREQNSVAGVVVIIDSLEQIRGTRANEETVQQAVEQLFSVHASSLRLPDVHVVYTVPPWLKYRVPNLGGGLDTTLQMLYPVKVASAGPERADFEPGISALSKLVARRAPSGGIELFESSDQLRKLICASGGHLRDLLLMVRELLVSATSFPVDERAVARTIAQLRRDYLPVADEDAAWLARVAETGKWAVVSDAQVPRFSKFLDTHLVLCYRNGEKWYDVQPLIRDEVVAQARAIAAEGDD